MKWLVVVEKHADQIEVYLQTHETDEETDYVIVLEWSTSFKEEVRIPELATRFVSGVPTEAFLVFSTTIADLNSGKRMVRAKPGYKRVVWESPHVT